MNTYSMSAELLAEFIKLAVREAHLARVPNQLISDDGHEGEENADDEKDVNEFSGAGGGAIMGYSGPLGGSGDASRPTASVGQRKRRKKQ